MSMEEESVYSPYNQFEIIKLKEYSPADVGHLYLRFTDTRDGSGNGTTSTSVTIHRKDVPSLIELLIQTLESE